MLGARGRLLDRRLVYLIVLALRIIISAGVWMKKLRLYLDTSIINFIFADDAPEKKTITKDFFENYVKQGVFDVFISDVVMC
jgi:hypothetical protein